MVIVINNYVYYIQWKGGIHIMTSDFFNFTVPFDIVKSESKDDKEPEMRIGGYASTATEDRQGDEIIQKGLDFSDFVNYGYINYDHKSDVILGYPVKGKCKVDSHGFYIEAILVPGPGENGRIAKSMWETTLALQKLNAPRHPGFSVEGKVLKRNAIGQIVKAKIYNVAATWNPVNTSCTFQALAKSFTKDENDIDMLDKSLEAGYGDATGSPMIPESLDSAFKTLSYIIGNDAESIEHMNALKKRLQERQDLTKSEQILYLQLTKGLSFADSASLVNKHY
jgi:hypothetical protein